jgi:pentatricopeptide repeat protein
MGDVIAQDELVQALIEHKIHLDTHMLHSLMEGLMHNNEIERAFLFLRDLRTQGVIPKRNTYNLLIGICEASHNAEDMFRLLLDFKDTWGDNSIHERTWWKVLDVCAEESYVRPPPHVDPVS